MSIDHAAVLTELNDASDRDRIARDLHYLVVSRIDATRMLIDHAREEGAADAPELLAEASRILVQTKEDIRTAVVEWRRSDDSLVAEIREVVDTYASLMHFTPTVELVGPVSEIPGVVGENVVPVLREALSNVARHAAAEHGSVQLRLADDEVQVRVEDDGVGLPTVIVENGLRHARRRAESLGGSLEVRPRHPRGTVFAWRAPISRG
ncbi:ATP-binding protein [Nocardioides sp. CN2-186]|uniref:sensor histidine kinase n=1 Tax=Nocardioides tweenelious TaxID=3156607 RepID=UPI0032B52246